MSQSRLIVLTVALVACQADGVTSPDEVPRPEFAVTATVNQSDGFEDAALSPFWTVYEDFGSVTLSADQAHGGTQSVRMSSRDGGNRGMFLEHRFPELMKGSVSVWFYDTKAGQDGLYATLSVFTSHIAWGQPGYLFFVGVMDWDYDWYHVQGAVVVPYGFATSVRRTVGWHQFRINYDTDRWTIFVDDVRVAEFTGDYAFEKVDFGVSGPSWRSNSTFYWDDFTMEVYPAASAPNQSPSADAGGDQTVECSGHDGTLVALDGSGSSDPDGTIASYEWTENGEVIATGVSPTVTFGLGAHAVTLRVTDDDGATGEDEVAITVEDTQPPTIDMTVSPTVLWPPNHTMHQVASGIAAVDVCDPAAALVVAVTSNEPENGLGDGDAAPDWQIVANEDGAFDVWVRAERSGTGTGRVYTITATATDGSGNTASASGTVTVPHSRGR